jgi:hypothetical protein
LNAPTHYIAANSHSYIAIPIAASARTTFISHVLSATSLTTVIVDKETLPILLSVAEGSSVKYVIVNGTPSSAELASAKEKNIQLEEFKNIEYIGEAHPIDPVVPGKVYFTYIFLLVFSGGSNNGLTPQFTIQNPMISAAFISLKHLERSVITVEV